MLGEKSCMDQKGYVIAVCEDSDSYYLSGVEHIERNDDIFPWEFIDDADAAKGAERDGFKLIYGLQGVEDGVYLDTPQNRARIAREKDIAEKTRYFDDGKVKGKKEFITDETAIALANTVNNGVEAFSQKLQDLGFEAASKAVDCAFEL